MNAMKKVVIGLGVVAISAGGLAACGHHRYQDPVKKVEYVAEEVDEELQLNETQRANLTQLKDKIVTLIVEVKENKQSTHEQVNALLAQPTLDQQKLLDLVHGHTEHVNSKAPEMIAALAGFYDSLTLEQQSTLKEQFEKHHQRHHGWHD